jgi:hypothetical protein
VTGAHSALAIALALATALLVRGWSRRAGATAPRCRPAGSLSGRSMNAYLAL